MSLGVPEQFVDDIIKIVERPVLRQIGVHEMTVDLLASMHTGTFFEVGSAGAISVNKGDRQGCRFGGKIFNLTYALPLTAIKQKLIERNIAMQVRWNENDPIETPGLCKTCNLTSLTKQGRYHRSGSRDARDEAVGSGIHKQQQQATSCSATRSGNKRKHQQQQGRATDR